MKIKARPTLLGIGTTAAVLAAVLAAPTAAWAHDGLVSSTPEAGSTVDTELDAVSLTFSDELLDIGDSNGAYAIQIIGPDELYYNLECVERDGRTASTSVALGESGDYQVIWQVISSDGHPTSDSFEFTYEAPETAVAAIGSEVAPCIPGGPADNEGDASADAGDGGAGSITPLLFGGGAVLVILIAAAIAIAVLRPKNTRRGDDAA